jgi:hypothetical protein
MDGPTDLYETDFYAWTRQQADALRALASERSNLPLDLEHLAEEVEDMGLSEFRRLRSLLEQAVAHLALIVADREADAVRHWRGEARLFLRDAARDATPTLRRKVAEVWPRIWTDGVERAAIKLDADGRPPPDLPAEPAFGVDEALSADVDALLARLRPSSP